MGNFKNHWVSLKSDPLDKGGVILATPVPKLNLPLKRRCYARAMTVCIAARCKWEDGRNALVLCADGRLDQGEWGHSDTANKFHALGWNFFGIMADQWATARELCGYIESEHHKALGKPENADDAVTRFQRYAEAFSKSVLCTGNASVLVTGFIQERYPLLINVKIEDRQVIATIAHDLEVIGEGCYAALTMLKYRGYDPLGTPFPRASYLVYEAKRFSENVSSVGPITRMKVHLPLKWEPLDRKARFIQHPEEETYEWRDFSPEALEQLEELRKKSFLQPVPDFSFKGNVIE